MRSPFQSVVYVQVLRNWLSVRVLSWSGGDSHWDGFPEALISVGKRGRLIARVVDGVPTEDRHCVLFRHPRTLIDSPNDFGLVLSLFARKAGLKSSPAKPILILHIREPLEGGLTLLEETAFRRALSRIAGEVRFVYEDHPMTPPDILSLAKSSAR